LAKLIRRCLAKNPEDRLQAAKDLRNELRELKQDVESGEVFEKAIQQPRPVKWMIGIAVAVVATAALTYLLTRGGQLTGESESVPIQGSLTQLTSQPGPEWFPSLSPDGDNVVYNNMETGNWDIYLKRVGGERVINLTEDSPADDKQPAFSPDGELIAFRSERDGGGIFLMGATGESVRRLTDFGYNPAWSPDGKEIAIATEEIDGPFARWTKSQLWAVDVTSAEKRLITDGDAVQPSWSPHGNRIAYWAGAGSQRDIRTIPSDGGGAVPVTEDAHVDWNPVWSPDGKFIYFSSDRGGSTNLWRVRVDEATGDVLGQPESVTTGASASRQHLSFSKDGERIAYVEQIESRNMWKVGFDATSGTVEGEPVPLIPDYKLTLGLVVSPDGDWLAFSSSGLGVHEDIYVMRTDGSNRRQLTDDVHYDRGGSWSPDGEKIAFYSNRGESPEIWTIHPDGSELRKLTETPAQNIGLPAWSPDGLRMSYYDFPGQTSYIFDTSKPWEEQTPVALPPLSDDGKRFQAFSWSPDGRWLAGNYGTVPWRSDGIALYSLETQQYRELTDFGYFPTWLADHSLLFTSSGGIHMVDIESGNVHEVLVLSFSPNFNFAEVSHDLRMIYFTRLAYEANIWMLTLNEEQK
jgi:Tol biopolymer transport system component